jgi:hypothetical protein
MSASLRPAGLGLGDTERRPAGAPPASPPSPAPSPRRAAPRSPRQATARAGAKPRLTPSQGARQRSLGRGLPRPPPQPRPPRHNLPRRKAKSWAQGPRISNRERPGPGANRCGARGDPQAGDGVSKGPAAGNGGTQPRAAAWVLGGWVTIPLCTPPGAPEEPLELLMPSPLPQPPRCREVPLREPWGMESPPPLPGVSRGHRPPAPVRGGPCPARGRRV